MTATDKNDEDQNLPYIKITSTNKRSHPCFSFYSPRGQSCVLHSRPPTSTFVLFSPFDSSKEDQQQASHMNIKYIVWKINRFVCIFLQGRRGSLLFLYPPFPPPFFLSLFFKIRLHPDRWFPSAGFFQFTSSRHRQPLFPPLSPPPQRLLCYVAGNNLLLPSCSEVTFCPWLDRAKSYHTIVFELAGQPPHPTHTPFIPSHSPILYPTPHASHTARTLVILYEGTTMGGFSPVRLYSAGGAIGWGSWGTFIFFSSVNQSLSGSCSPLVPPPSPLKLPFHQQYDG